MYVPRVFDAFTVPKTHFDISIIVMEYIALPDSDKSDSELVAKAVQRLHDIKAPALYPAPLPEVRLYIPYSSTGILVSRTRRSESSRSTSMV